MIKLNNREHPWYEGMTVRQLLNEKGFVYNRITVKVNGLIVPEEQWADKAIADGDEVAALHLMAGG